MPESLTHMPPQEIEAEQQVLGACLLDPQHTIGSAHVRADDFYKSAHRVIFTAMQRLLERGEDVDVITLAAALRDEKTMESVGGPATYLATLLSLVPTAANFRAHERLVISAAIRRAAIRVLREAMNEAHAASDAENVISGAVTALTSIRRHYGDEIVHQRDLIVRGLEAVERRSMMTGELAGIPTGFAELDRFLDGLLPQYYVLGGRPSMGKTALAEGIIRNAARAGHRAGLISIEMGEHQIAMRALSRSADIPLSRLLRGDIRGDEWDRLARAAAVETDLPIEYAFSSFSERQVERAIDDMVQRLGCKLIVVDYLQLMGSDEKDGTREQEVSRQSRMFKRKVKEHRIPHLILSQLNRKVEERPDKRPVLADLRETGGIEQDADVIMFVYRDEVYNCRCPKGTACSCGRRGKAEILVRKGRMEGTGNIDVIFEARITSFRDAEPRVAGQSVHEWVD